MTIMRWRWLMCGLVWAGCALQAKPKPPAPDAAFRQKLSKDEQVIHALDRLSYGPRPGDFAQVKRLGVKKWVEQQLRPEKLREDPEMLSRLDELETLSLSPLQVAQRHPTQAMVAAALEGKSLPADPALAARIRYWAAFYRLQEDADPGRRLVPRALLPDLLTAEEIRLLESGKNDQKVAVLRAIPPQAADAVLAAMPASLRGRLASIAPVAIRRRLLAFNSPQQVVSFDLTEGKLQRALRSRRQLQELLVDFWFNHFNVYLDKGNERFVVPTYEREAIRPFVLGRFRDLLGAVAHSPAMLVYLDNAQSVAPPVKPRPNARGLNENYARELLELHTLGVDGGYTQKDVTEVARCFTGWTVEPALKGSGFLFNEKTHDQGEKLVLGTAIPAGGGGEDGERVLDLLSRQPAAARFVATKLAQRFVSNQAPRELIDQMAKSYLEHDGDLREVMRTLLTHKQFWSKGAYRAKVKSPLEVVVSAARALDAEVDLAQSLATQIANLGQPLYRKSEPTGYYNNGEDWVSGNALLARMNFALSLTQNRFLGVQVDAAQFPEDDQEQLVKQLLAGGASPQTRAALASAQEAQARKNPKKPALSKTALAGLVLGSPDFQRR